MDRDNSSTANPPELAALTAVVTALKPLDPQTRMRVVESALVLLGSGFRKTELPGVPPSPIERERGPTLPARTSGDQLTDIRQLKQQKAPQSANEMAALVAYYLAEAAPPEERKTTVDINDMQKYFKQAPFRLPNNPQMTLVNAKNAGYFDAAGGGLYRLNPVGYNLVAHSLPRSAAERRPARKRTSQRKRRRLNQPKKSTARR